MNIIIPLIGCHSCVTHAEIEAAMGEYKNEQAYNHTLEKDDSQ